MNTIKESFIFQFLVKIFNKIENMIKNSLIYRTIMSDNEETHENGFFLNMIYGVLNILRKIFNFLKLDKVFKDSIFAKPIIWTTITIALVPILPTMVILALVIVSMLSLILKAIITPEFKFKYYRINKWIVAFSIVIAISALTSISKVESIKIALLMIAFILFYFVIVNTITSFKQLKVILYVLISVATITAIYGIYQYAFGDIYSQAWLDGEMFEDIKMRVYSTLENPNVYGEYLLLIIPVIAALLWTEKSFKKKMFLFICLGITGLALILTFSRGCWLGILFAFAVLAIIIDRRFIFLGIGILCILPFVLPDTIINRFMSIGDMQDSSTSYRVYIWMGTLAMLKDYWLSGVGMGITSFNTIYPLYSYNNIVAPHSHNLYLQVLVEYGIVGFITLAGVMYNYFKELFISMNKNKNILIGGFVASILGFLLQSMTDHTWYNYRVVLMFWVIIGISIVASKLSIGEKENDKSC